MSTKTSKTLSKRIRVTRTGKVIRRTTGVSHSHTRRSAKAHRRKNKTFDINYPVKKVVNY